MKLSEQDYVKKAGAYCPKCGSKNIAGSFIDIDGVYATQHVDCADCRSTWADVYELVGYDNFEDGDDETQV